jgi:hypothetical protein
VSKPAKLTEEQRNREREIYNSYQRAQLGNGYLLIGVVGKKKNGKQLIRAY